LLAVVAAFIYDLPSSNARIGMHPSAHKPEAAITIQAANIILASLGALGSAIAPSIRAMLLPAAVGIVVACVEQFSAA